MVRGIGTVAEMKTLEETILKEDLARLGWHDKSRHEASYSLAGGGSKQFNIMKRKIELSGPVVSDELLKRLKEGSLRQQAEKLNAYREKMASLNAQTGKRDQSILREMKPPTPNSRSLLYDGFSREEKGRYQYLKLRHARIPETKYQFPLLNSWDIGWRLSEIVKKEDIRKPTYGRTGIIRDSFFTRTGIPGVSQPGLPRLEKWNTCLNF